MGLNRILDQFADCAHKPDSDHQPGSRATALRSLMVENPSKFVRGDHPVEQVTLADVMRFVDRLNAGSPSGLRFNFLKAPPVHAPGQKSRVAPATIHPADKDRSGP